MTRTRRSFSALPTEARKALLHCAQHGAATLTTLMDLSFGEARKASNGSPHLRNQNSRINTSCGKKRLATLVKEGFLARACVKHEANGSPLWAVVPDDGTRALSFVPKATGDIHTGIMRSRVAAGLVRKGYATGRSLETLELWSGELSTGSYRCMTCGKERLPGPFLCPKAPGACCILMPVLMTGTGALVRAHADVAYLATVETMRRCIIWIDDGRPLPEQWDEIAPLAALARDPRLMVVVRPHGFDSGYSNVRKGWPTMGPRLILMTTLVNRAGYMASRGGSFGHRYCID